MALGQMQQDGSFGGGVDTRDAVEERSLACAVGADERDNLLLVDGEINVVQSAQSTEVLGKAGDFKHGDAHA